MDIKVDNLDFGLLRLIDETGQYVEYDLLEELKVNEDNLLTEMLEQPSKYIYWSSILERIKFYQEGVELELELKVAELDPEARSYLKQQGEKPTKDMVDAYVKRQDSYIEIRKRMALYEHISGRMNRIVKSFEQRKDMLQSYGKQVAENKLFGRGAGSKFEKFPDAN